jgi:hypothetical protein
LKPVFFSSLFCFLHGLKPRFNSLLYLSFSVNHNPQIK